MADWSLGSVSEEVITILDDVPVTISGAPLMRMADRAREKVQTYTGQTIGSKSISIQFQNAILYQTIADTASLMNATGADVSSIRIGDFTESKGGASNIENVSKAFQQKAWDEMKNIGRRVDFYKSRG